MNYNGRPECHNQNWWQKVVMDVLTLAVIFTAVHITLWSVAKNKPWEQNCVRIILRLKTFALETLAAGTSWNYIRLRFWDTKMEIATHPQSSPTILAFSIIGHSWLEMEVPKWIGQYFHHSNWTRNSSQEKKKRIYKSRNYAEGIVFDCSMFASRLKK